MDKASYMKALEESSVEAVIASRRAAIAHYRDVSGAGQREAEEFYDRLRPLMEEFFVVANMAPEDFLDLVSGKEARLGRIPLIDEAVDLLGCRPLVRAHVRVGRDEHGDRSIGDYALSLSGVKDDVVVVSGEWGRLVNPHRDDFVSDPSMVVFCGKHMADARTSAAIWGLTRSEAAAGPDAALEALVESSPDRGSCQALLLRDVSAADVSKVMVSSEENLIIARTVLGAYDRLLPVVSSGPRSSPKIFISSPRAEAPAATSHYIEVGDRVSLKRIASHPERQGEVVDASNGRVVVQWDDNERESMGIGEALLSLMPEPRLEEMRMGAVSYELPGLDEDSVEVMCRMGVDPVNISSLASHYLPSSDAQRGWMDGLIDALGVLGLRARFVNGLAPGPGGIFEKASWLEVRLPLGNRLVLDLAPGRMVIRAGPVEEYVAASEGYHSFLSLSME